MMKKGIEHKRNNKTVLNEILANEKKMFYFFKKLTDLTFLVFFLTFIE